MRAAFGSRWLAGFVLAMLIGTGLWVAQIPMNAEAFVLYPCHDDTSVSRTNSHGSPLNGTFGTPGAAKNHSNSYYYLDVSIASSCPVGPDGQIHLVAHVTANGVGLLSGHPVCSTSSWGPPCDPTWRREIGSAIAAETNIAWGFEYKDASNDVVVACAGGNGSGNHNGPPDCMGVPNVEAHPGDATVEFRYNAMTSTNGFRFRATNEYFDPSSGGDVVWETASLDVVSCSTCEP
jgi:hypothetical protein